MKVIIAGGRDFKNAELFVDCLEKTKFEIQEVVSGGADGADKYGEWFADEIGLKLKQFPADWDKYGKSAGPKRNRKMAKYADALIVFFDGKSRGTKNMIQEMKKLGKPIEEWRY
jgi:hypothetical protein